MFSGMGRPAATPGREDPRRMAEHPIIPAPAARAPWVERSTIEAGTTRGGARASLSLAGAGPR